MTGGFLGALRRRAAAEPDRVLITLHAGGAAHDLTQAGLLAEAGRWAHLFQVRGAKPETIIPIALPLSADLIHAFVGTLLAGCVPALMPYPSAKQGASLFWSNHAAVFRRLGAALLVTSEENRAAIAADIGDIALSVATPRDASRAGLAPDPYIHVWHDRDIACLQHSSGTTGLKKGVMLSFAKIEAQIAAHARALRLTAADTIVSWLPLYHDMGFIACFLLPLTLGAKTILMDPFDWLVDPLALFDLIDRHRGRFVWLPNFAFNHLANAAADIEPRAHLGSVRAFINCSEPCRTGSMAAFEARFRAWGLAPGRVLTCYAMAETVFAVTQSAPGLPPRVIRCDRAGLESGRLAAAPPDARDGVDVVSSGCPLPGVEIAILDDGRRPAGAGRVGQIAVRAPFLFDGYHRQPDRTAAAFHEGFFVTGDIGCRIDDDLFVLGRQDDVLILLGRSLFAGEIEDIVGATPGIKPGRVFAMGIESAEIGSQELIVLAEPDGSEADYSRIRARIRSRLRAVLGVAPKRTMVVEPGWLVKSTSGKLNRKDNRRKYETGRHAGTARQTRKADQG